jgi:glycolate oxidase
MILSNAAYKKLKKIVGNGNISRKHEDLTCYAYDASAHVYYPDAVLFPGNADEVAAVLRLANEENVYVVPRGSGSGLTGGSLPVKGGIILVMTRFNRIFDIDRDNLTACVEPGVVTGRFHTAVEKEGLFYPPDPASSGFSTLGGNIAECSGGPRAVKYGVTRDYVLGLEVVLPTGEVIHTGVQTTKGVVGYDLTRLFTGSEGTLGILTNIIFRLLPLPSSVRTMTAVFNKIETAAETVSEIIRQGLIPRTIEFMDKASLECVEGHMNIGLPADADALLLIEVDGKKDITARDIKELKDLCLSLGAINVRLAADKEEAESLWKARKAISPALFRYGPDKINEDIVVPRSKIPDMVRKIDELRNGTGLTMASFGHAGDGNIHFNIMLDKKNKDELKKAEAAIEKVFDYTIELGGTISGEHGIGITKAPYLNKELGTVEIALMKKLKQLFDPKGILNPGKIFLS